MESTLITKSIINYSYLSIKLQNITFLNTDNEGAHLISLESEDQFFTPAKDVKRLQTSKWTDFK